MPLYRFLFIINVHLSIISGVICFFLQNSVSHLLFLCFYINIHGYRYVLPVVTIYGWIRHKKQQQHQHWPLTMFSATILTSAEVWPRATTQNVMMLSNVRPLEIIIMFIKGLNFWLRSGDLERNRKTGNPWHCINKVFNAIVFLIKMQCQYKYLIF